MATVYDEGWRATLTRDGVETHRVLRVTPSSEAAYVCDLLLGGCRLIGGFLFRIPPARDPHLPWCICQSVEVEGVGAYTGDTESGLQNIIKRSTYSQGWRLHVTYRTPEAGQSTLDPRDGDLENPPGQQSSPPTGQGTEPTNQQEIDLASESYDWSYEYAPLDGQFMGFAPNVGETVTRLLSSSNVFVRKRIPKIDVQLIRHYVIRAPWEAISKLAGTVNKTAFTRARVSWPKETMRFDGLQTSRKLTSFGIKFWELTFKFQILTLWDNISSGGKGYVGWNRMYDVKDKVWSYVVGAENTSKTLFEYDEDNYSTTVSGATVAGFKALFHPRILS